MKYFGLLIFSYFLVSTNTGLAMSFFQTNETDAVLFSEMSGVITHNGEPAEGVMLNLSVSWNENEKIQQSFVTNAKGEFLIPKIERKIATSPLVQLAISQIIIAQYNDTSYDFWIRSKRDIEEYSETEGKPKNFRCELSDPLRRIEVKSGQLGTPCRWDHSE